MKSGDLTFDWPCDRRDAHGPHIIYADIDAPWDAQGAVECPGIRAHPATMIGRPARESQK